MDLFNILPRDLVVYICQFINSINIIFFLSTCKTAHTYKSYVFFKKRIDINKIYHLWYFDQFTNICNVTQINLNKLPKHTKVLSFSEKFNTDLSNISFKLLPKGITHIIFGEDFNSPIGDFLPKTIKYLEFGKSFDQDINNIIPEGVTHLVFGFSFNKNIKNAIPKSVIYLRFGWCFNQPIDTLPSGIRYLFFGHNFSFNLINNNFESLMELELGMEYNHNYIPYGINKLKINNKYNKFQKYDIPQTVHYLDIQTLYFEIPANVKVLRCNIIKSTLFLTNVEKFIYPICKCGICFAYHKKKISEMKHLKIIYQKGMCFGSYLS